MIQKKEKKKEKEKRKKKGDETMSKWYLNFDSKVGSLEELNKSNKTSCDVVKLDMIYLLTII